MTATFRRWAFPAGVLAAFAVFLLAVPSLWRSAIGTIGYGLGEMLLVIPPTFLLLGLLDVWVPREKMIRAMGPGSGLKGGALAFFLGSAAAGPLYAAFPIAAVLMRKGADLVNVLIFIGATAGRRLRHRNALANVHRHAPPMQHIQPARADRRRDRSDRRLWAGRDGRLFAAAEGR